MIKLRPYQTAIIESVRSRMARGVKSILITAPTASGKTCLTASMLKAAAEKGNRSWFIVHRRELLKQAIKAFDEVGVPTGVIASGFKPDPEPRVQIASIQSLVRRFGGLEAPKLIIFDEAHHIAAKSWDKIYQAFPKIVKIGLTATPQRLDGKGLAKYFSEMILGPSVRTLIDQGYLADYKIFAPAQINHERFKKVRMGDYVMKDAAELVNKPSITGNVIDEYKKYASGKRAVVFCCLVSHSKEVATAFNTAGIRAEHVDGDTPTAQRDAAIDRFSRGVTLVLDNVDLFGEGFDLPALECAILLRPTKSLGLYLQQIGRALRPSPGKSHAIILDHVGNCEQHGFPDDERKWTLQGKIKRSAIAGPRVCRKCYFANKPRATKCAECGVLLAGGGTSREVPESVAGELKQLQRTAKAKENRAASTMDELVALAKRRGYKNPEGWASRYWHGSRGLQYWAKKYRGE